MRKVKTVVISKSQGFNNNILLLICATICLCSAVYTPSELTTKPPLSFDRNWNIHDAVKTASVRQPVPGENTTSGVIMHHNYSRISRHRIVDSEPETRKDEREEYLLTAASSDYRAYSSPERTAVQSAQSRTNIETIENRTPESFLNCPTNATGAYPYALDCKRFLNCWKGRGHIQNCGPGTLFNPRTHECDFPDKVQCTAYISQAEAFDVDRSPISHRRGKNNQEYGHDHETRRVGDRLEGFVSAESAYSASYYTPDIQNDKTETKCPEDFVGLIPDISDCTKFWNCNNGRNFLQECGPGTVFNPNINACDFEANYPCDLKTSYDRFGKEIEPSEPHLTNYNKKQTNQVKCPEDANGPTVHPYDCSKFLNCDRGRTFVQDCGPGTVFNPIISACDHPHKVKCDSGKNYDTEKTQTSQQSHKTDSFNTSKNEHQLNVDHNIHYTGIKVSNVNTLTGNTQTPKYPNPYNTHQGREDRTYNNFNSYGQPTSHGHVRPYNPSYGFIGTSINKTPAAHGYSRDQFNTPETAGSDISEVSQDYEEESVLEYPGTLIFSGSHVNPGIQSVNTAQREIVGTNKNILNTRPTVNIPSIKAVTVETASSNRESTYFPLRQGPGGHYIIRENNYENNFNRELNTRNEKPLYTHEIGFKHNIYPEQTTPYAISKSTQNIGSVSKNIYRNYEEPNLQYGTEKNSNPNHYIGNTNTKFDSPHRVTESSQSFYIFPQHVDQKYLSSTLKPIYIHKEPEKSVSVSKNIYRNYEEANKQQGVDTVSQANINPNLHFTSNSNSNFDSKHQTTKVTQNDYSNSPLNVDQKYLSQTVRPVYIHNPPARFDLEAASSVYVNFPYKEQLQENHEKITTGKYETTPLSIKTSQSSFTSTQNLPRLKLNVHESSTQKAETVDFDQKNFKYPYPFYMPQSANREEVEEQVPEGDFGVFGAYKDVLTTMKTSPFRNYPVEEPDYEILSQDSLTPLKIETLDQTIENSAKKNGSTTFKVCEKDQFRCDAHHCIPLIHVCDGKHQCSDSRDEANCTKNLDFFTKHKESKLEAHGVEKWMNIKLETCAQYCLQTKTFQCMSFNYGHKEKECMLSDSNIGYSGQLIYSEPYDYYELKAYSVNCDGKFQCDNLKCLDKAKVCDSIDDCGDRSDERQICQRDEINYAIRLAGSNKPNEGRLEIRVYGQWGFVCDDQFGIRDANVACRELGFSHGAVQVKGSSHFYLAGNEIAENIENNTVIMMDDVTCYGNETSLQDCTFNGWGVHDCSPQEIVGVVCKTPTQTCPQNYWMCSTKNECIPLPFLCDVVNDCDDGSDESDEFCKAPLEIRLVNGTSKSQGRVEVRHNGVWGTICDDDFSERSAKVICSQLGYNGSAIVKKEGAFGPGSGPIWLDRVICTGNEKTIESCHHDDWGQHNCGHDEDVGVICDIKPNVTQKPKLPKKTHSTVDTLPIKCGYRDEGTFSVASGVTFRVVAGSIAQKGHYPWQVSLRVRSLSKSSHWCGGVIISQHHILTAAHCLTGFSKGSYFIRAGDYDADVDEDTEAEAYVEDFYIHEEFRKGHHMNNDIALIKLKSNGLPLSKHIQPICLPDNRSEYTPGINCTISGWGSTKSGKSTASKQLRAGWIPLQSPDVCRMKEVYGNAITDGMICAGNLDEGVDACDGDSGGPLACLEKGLFTLYGITSWGQHCGYANKPGVYVKVAYYRNWIDEKIMKSMLDT